MRTRLMGLVVSLVFCAAINSIAVTARDLLSSPSQPMRNLGAQILRGSFVPPPRASWDMLMGRLRPGVKKVAVENALRSAQAVREGGAAAGTREDVRYRLDDVWVVNCSFTNAVLALAKIEEAMKDFNVPAPANFTGEWVTYWANGQPSLSRHYQFGKLEGAGTDYYPNGAKAVIYSFHNGVPDGDEVGYFKSGKINFKGRNRAGRQVGHWTWYKEDGKVEAEKDFGK